MTPGLPAPGPPAWPAPPAQLSLDDGELDVWLAALDGVPAHIGRRLSREELARAQAFASPRDGRLWASAHGLLRTLLGAYLMRDPLSFSFSATPHGKPILAAAQQVHFNLSHSGDLALFAFTRVGEVGVDVEVTREGLDVLGVAARMLGQARRDELAALDPPLREREFLRSWTRHEATLKCRGTGIGAAAADEGAHAGQEWVAELDAGPLAAAAVALAREPRELRRWAWPGALSQG